VKSDVLITTLDGSDHLVDLTMR